MEIKEGQIGLSGGNLFLQKAIKFFIGSDFSHTFIVLKGPYDILSVIETTYTIVCSTPFHNKDNEKNYIEMWQPIFYGDPTCITEALKEYYNKSSGMWYGYASFIWFIYRWFCRKIKVKEPKKMWKWTVTGTTCTESSVAGYISKLFPDLFAFKDINTITPKELRDIMVANPNKFEYLGWYMTKSQVA